MVANTTSANADCFASVPNDILTYQAQIGSIYYPNAPISISDVSENGNYESYYYSMYAADALSRAFNPSITLEQWTGVADKSQYNNNFIMFNLNSSNVSQLVGMTLNNSRALLLNITTQTAGVDRFDSYLQHLRATTVFTSNLSILD